ncbi:luc7 3 [Tubulinosema ratisbonensis]|uniref:Luc7 3 n=1 Tax=Tubulinosema ratisbonensis TaxID=291195 RepID=A0A437AM34_9MICR|nr:luc7 3 [Tubulinosema ratisbonensis]
MKKARILLDELLGPNRNLINKQKYCKNKHSSVCKYMLASFCPYTLLQSIKFTSLQCKFTNHDKGFIKLYEESGKPFLKEFESDLLRELKCFYSDFKNKLKIKNLIYELKMKEKLKEINKIIKENKLENEVFLVMHKFTEYKKLENELYLQNDTFVCVCGKEMSKDLIEEYYYKHKNGKYHKGMVYFLDKFNELLMKCEFN